MNIEWNATNYTNHFSFVHKYGEDVLKLIDAPAGSQVLDLGCGNGALTQKLQELGFQVQGLDASSEMLHVARKNYPDIRFEKGDATQFTLQDPVDVIFSNAVFHWIDAEKQDALARAVYTIPASTIFLPLLNTLRFWSATDCVRITLYCLTARRRKVREKPLWTG